MNAYRTAESKIISSEGLAALAGRLHAEGKRIVTTNGCFDLLHWGHLKYLAEARALGDVLICGVNSDASVKRLKGPQRPLCSEKERALQIASLEAIDYVTVFEDDTPVRLLKVLQPAIHAKGGDYEGKDIPEQKIVESFGGRMVFLPLTPGRSTTALIKLLKALPEK